jgi:hypothetical protein
MRISSTAARSMTLSRRRKSLDSSSTLSRAASEMRTLTTSGVLPWPASSASSSSSRPRRSSLILSFLRPSLKALATTSRAVVPGMVSLKASGSRALSATVIWPAPAARRIGRSLAIRSLRAALISVVVSLRPGSSMTIWRFFG